MKCPNPKCHDGSDGNVAGVATICRTCWGTGKVPDVGEPRVTPPEALAVVERGMQAFSAALAAAQVGDVAGWQSALTAAWVESGAARKWSKLR